MRVAVPVALVLSLVGAACGGDASSARGTASPGATSRAVVSSTSGSSRSTTVSVSFGTPLPASAAPRSSAPTPTPTPVATVAAHTAVPAPPPGPCAPANLGIATSTDRAAYTSGQTVHVRVVVRNLSAASCLFDAPGDFYIEGEPSGPAVYAVHLACAAGGCPPLAPGQMTTYPIDWNQVANQGAGVNQQVAPGAYHARAVFTGYPPTASAPFTLAP